MYNNWGIKRFVFPSPGLCKGQGCYLLSSPFFPFPLIISLLQCVFLPLPSYNLPLFVPHFVRISPTFFILPSLLFSPFSSSLCPFSPYFSPFISLDLLLTFTILQFKISLSPKGPEKFPQRRTAKEEVKEKKETKSAF